VWAEGSGAFLEFVIVPFDLGWWGILLAICEIAVGIVISTIAGFVMCAILDGLFHAHLLGGDVTLLFAARCIAIGFGVLALAWALFCYGGAIAEEWGGWSRAKANLKKERDPTWQQAKTQLKGERPEVGFRSGLLIGGLLAAVVALGVAVVVLATGRNTPPTVVVAHDDACPVTESGGAAELDLSASGLDCAQGRAIYADFKRVGSAAKADGAIVVMGWTCTVVSLSEYPTLARCRSKDGHLLDVLGKASRASIPQDATHPPGPTAAKSERARNSLKPEIFQTPSENIGCKMDATRVVCDIFKFEWSPPPAPASCEQPSTWGHTIIFQTSRSTFSCADRAQVNPGPRTPILHYGKTVAVGPFACESRVQALVCVSKSGHGFLLSPQKVDAFLGGFRRAALLLSRLR